MYNTIYPVRINPYTGVKNNQIVKSKEDEQRQQRSSDLQREEYESRENQRINAPQKYSAQEFPNGNKTVIDYSSSSVNIAQVITDFTNTTLAIGAPEDVLEEVNAYLGLVEKQTLKDEPSKKIIQTNLKNASQILDKYITDTLNKPSNVVEGWIDALFLQKIDLKANSEALNPDFKVKLPEKQAPETVSVQNEPEKPQVQNLPNGFYIPEDAQLKKLFVQAKKYSQINEPKKSLEAFGKTLEHAKQIDDKQAQAIVHFEVGKLYDGFDFIPQALKNYNEAAIQSQDENIKAQAHYRMARIYDDVVEFDGAMNHYFASIAFSGANDNMNAQTKALSSVAQMFTGRYDKKNAIEYFTLAQDISKETADPKLVGSTYKKSAMAYTELDEPTLALKSYKNSSQNYEKVKETKQIVDNYIKASELMEKLNNKTKAQALLKKAFDASKALNDKEYSLSIFNRIS